MDNTSPIKTPGVYVVSVWTIYYHPSDYPTSYIARRFDVIAGKAVATHDMLMHDDLGTIRAQMIAHGLFCLGREVRDAPNVVESWI